MSDFLEDKKNKNLRNFFIKICGLFILSFLVFIFSITEMTRRDFVDVSFLDVGQGDGIMIEIHSKDRNPIHIMIDTGRSSRTLTSLDKFYARDIINYFSNIILGENIDTLILTHNDDDHVGMRCEIISRYHVRHVLISPSMNESQIKKCTPAPNSFTVDYIYTGDEINFRNVNFKILNPNHNQKGDDNNLGIVTLVTIPNADQNTKILFTADIDQKIETNLINKDANSTQPILKNINILKVAHHGSDGSSGENFIKYTHPKTAIISVGKNNYGHPSSRVIDLLTFASSTIRRTDKEGNITIRILN